MELRSYSSVFHRILGGDRASRAVGIAVGTMFLLISSIWETAAAYNRNDNRPLNLWPLFSYERDSESGTVDLEFLWPFIIFKGGQEGYEYALRPLFNIRKEDNNALHEGQFLWPLGWCKKTPEKKRIRVYPLYYYNKDTLPNGGEKSSYQLFPIIFSGQSGEEKYFALFPLGGQLNRWLGKDRIRFFLFPLYTDSLRGDYRSRYILWPIFSFARGEEGKEKAYRIWPLFGHGFKSGEYSKHFFLWPLFNFERTRLDTEKPREALMILPFYARQKSPDRRTESVLWPFFTYTNNRIQNYKEWHFPWPVFSRVKGREREGYKFWPLWTYQRKDDSESLSALWPLYWSRKETSEGSEKKRNIIFPFYRSESETWKEEGKSTRHIKFWPLLNYKREKDEALKLTFLSPLWFREEDGFERNYSSFWKLYEYRRDSEGRRLSRVLWKLYRHERTDSSRSLELIHLLSYQRERNEETRFSLLRGLFGYKRERNRKTLRFLYLLKFPLTSTLPPGAERKPEVEFN